MMFTVILSLLLSSAFSRPHVDPEMTDILNSMVEEIDEKITHKPILKLIEQMAPSKVDAGEKLVLRCEVTSTPTAVFYWTHNGVLVQGDKNLNVIEKLLNSGRRTVQSGIVSSEFVIPCASSSDAGVYKCVAVNGYKTIESEAEVTVVGDSAQCKPAHRSAPTISQWTDSRFEAEGNTATLVCRSHSATKTVTSWTFEGELINTQGGRFEVLENGDLLVRNIRWEDMGSYECIVSNKYGEARVETFLYPSKKLSA